MSTLPRYRRPPMAREGAISLRKRPVRRLVYEVVARRARAACELCGHGQDPLHCHHTYGRGHLPGIPAEVCDTEELILGLCNNDPREGRQGCHERIHSGDLALMDQARWMAISRFAGRQELSTIGLPGDPIDAMRELVRQVKQREEVSGG